MPLLLLDQTQPLLVQLLAFELMPLLQSLLPFMLLPLRAPLPMNMEFELETEPVQRTPQLQDPLEQAGYETPAPEKRKRAYDGYQYGWDVG